MNVELNHFYNCDCMDLMNSLPDKFIDLAIVDPPYGIGVHKAGYIKGKTEFAHNFEKNMFLDVKPDQAYFDELFRISKEQIIFGGNYFTDILPPSKGWIVWDKRCNNNSTNDFADCELAWASKGVARVFRFLWDGFRQQNMKEKETRIHPTQKPVALYEWILKRYAKPGDIILDTHCGSASSLVACHRLGFKYIGCELDEYYYQQANERLETEKAQITFNDLQGEQYEINFYNSASTDQ